MTQLAHMANQATSQTAYGMMGNWGPGWGWFWLVTGTIFWLASLVAVILLIIWLVKQIQK